MQRQSYQIADKADSRKIAEFLGKDGQLLLPFLELICSTEQAIDELIDVAGKAAIEAVLLLSAEQLAGPKQPGKAHGDITWHGRQHGVVSLSERKLRIDKPRLRRKPRRPTSQRHRKRKRFSGLTFWTFQKMDYTLCAGLNVNERC